MSASVSEHDALRSQQQQSILAVNIACQNSFACGKIQGFTAYMSRWQAHQHSVHCEMQDVLTHNSAAALHVGKAGSSARV